MPPIPNESLPGVCRQRRHRTARLLARFEAWGYTPVAPPALERYDDLARGLSDDDRRRCIRFVAPPDGRLLALRADVTPQIARMLAQRIGGTLPDDAVIRVCYAAEVVRHASAVGERAQLDQVGVELVGDDHALADAELVALCHEALDDVGLSEHRVDLAHTGVAAAVVDALGLEDSTRAQVRSKLAHKDRDGLLALLAGHPDAAVVASLCDRFGDPSVLEGAEEAFTPAAAAIERLRAVADAVATQADVPLTVDLGEVRGDDYYSGLRLRAWAPGVSRPVVRGGRYDHLLSHYGIAMPATGFAIDLDALDSALAQGSADAAPGGVAFAVPPGPALPARRREAAQRAASVRAAGGRAWVTPVRSAARAAVLAGVSGADEVVVLAADCRPQRHRCDAGVWVQVHNTKEEGS